MLEDETHVPSILSPEQWAQLSRSSIDSMDSWDFNDDEVHISAYTTQSRQNPASHELYPPQTSHWLTTDKPGLNMMLADQETLAKFPQVYCIIFGAGVHDGEGIYSLRAYSDDGLPHETIIVFESHEDAERFGTLLEATMAHVPTVCTLSLKELLSFCSEHGHTCRLEPHGSLLIPPDFNVAVTDWEMSLKLRDGRYSVLEAEPNVATSGGSGRGPMQQLQMPHLRMGLPGPRPSHHQTRLTRYHPSFTEENLDDIRTSLERCMAWDE